MATNDEQRELLRSMIKDIDIAMFTTVSKSGYPVSRPLSTQKVDFDGELLWFFTRGDSPKIAELRKSSRVNVAYASASRNTYVSVTGDAEVMRDQAKINELWSDALKAFFPNGPDDPKLKLIRVRVATAEYWDGPSSAIGKLVSFVIARVTKNDEFMGENRIMQLRGPNAGRSAKAPGETSRRKPMPKAAQLPKSAAKPRSGAASKGAAAATAPASKRSTTSKSAPASKRWTASKRAATKSTTGTARKGSVRKEATKKPGQPASLTRTATKKTSGTRGGKSGTASRRK